MNCSEYEALVNQTVLPDLEIAKRAVRAQDKSAFRIPEDVLCNLRHPLRYYQTSALENFIAALGAAGPAARVNPRHHLLHAATGSGKTTLMAGAMLYLYGLGYRKFIFVTNQLNLINKTRLNLLPALGSSKLEFRPTICIRGQRIAIREVDRFGALDGVDVEVLFTTIHALHGLLHEGKENRETRATLAKHKIAILADEAHHFNTATSGMRDEESSWETSLQIVLSANPASTLLELTATMPLENKRIFAKYRDKLIFDYTLRRFREDGYSKEICLVQLASASEVERAVIAVMVSQYRQDLAQEDHIPLIPRLLIKCGGTIQDLERKEQDVLTAIAALTKASVKGILRTHAAAVPVLKNMQEHYANGDALKSFVARIHVNYCKATSRVIHSKNSPAAKLVRMEELNTVDANPTVRLIFAINILNEGWDVLSLFDIVKFDDAKVTTSATIAEAQLIGRGARIFPYAWSDGQGALDPFKRKFDDRLEDPLRILDELYFYSESNNAYIAALRNDLVRVGLKRETELRRTNIRINPRLQAFAKRMYTRGFVISNGSLPRFEAFKHLADFDIGYNAVISAVESVTTVGATESCASTMTDIVSIDDLLSDYPAIVHRAIRRVPAWSLNCVNETLSGITTTSALICELARLGDAVSITVEGTTFARLPFDRKLEVLTSVLTELAAQIARKKLKRSGGKQFDKRMPIRTVFVGYTKDSTKVFGYCKSPIIGTNASGRALSKSFAVEHAELFYYDQLTWDSGLELEMYKLFDQHLSPTEYLVIRNEVGFKLYGTEPTADGEGFEPDFVVLRDAGSEVVQYFVEVKAESRKAGADDAWKERLLESLTGQFVVNCDGDFYKLVGLPFFTEERLLPAASKCYAHRLKSGKIPAIKPQHNDR